MIKKPWRYLTIFVLGMILIGSYELIKNVVQTKPVGLEELENRVWIERLPKTHRDMIHHLAVVNSRHGRFGAAGYSSSWKHMINIFHWSLEGNQLRLLFPQEEVRVDFTARVWDCEAEAPKPFELCLELTHKDQRLHYYSRYDWVIEPDSKIDILDMHVQTLISQHFADFQDEQAELLPESFEPIEQEEPLFWHLR